MVESNEDEMISAGNVDDEVSANFANRVLRGSARDMWAGRVRPSQAERKEWHRGVVSAGAWETSQIPLPALPRTTARFKCHSRLSVSTTIAETSVPVA